MPKVKAPFTSRPGRAFYGLVIQKGPWKSTYSDYLRAHQVPGGAKGGGVPVGGTGEGKSDAVMTPYQQNGRGVLPDPSEHATQSIVRPGEAWKIKKPMMGGKQMKGTKMTYALTIAKARKDASTDYEDISHATGMEPSGPPPPPDSSFLTEERLGLARNENRLTVVTSNLPPSRQAGIRTEGTTLEPGSMPDISSEFYPKEKRKTMVVEGSGREKKGKLTLPPKLGKDIITMREAEKMKRAADAKKGALKDKFVPSKKRKASVDMEGDITKKLNTSTLKRKPDTERISGKKKSKTLQVPPIRTTNLASSRQSSTRAPGIIMERNSTPRTSDALPAPRTRAALRRANGTLANVPVDVPRNQRRDSGFSGL